MRLRTVLLTIAGLSLAAAAGADTTAAIGPGGGTSSRTAPIPQTGPHQSPRPAATLTTLHASYPRGSSIVFDFTINNDTGTLVHYDFSTAQQFDVTVIDPRGVPIWRWSQGRVFAQMLTAVDLKDGESKSYTATWNTSAMGDLPTGTYYVTASLTPTIRPTVRGGLLVNPDVDPNNVGLPTRGRTESGAVVQVNVTPGVSASTKIKITGR